MDENQMNNGMSTDNQDVSEGKHELQEGENHEVSTSKIDVIDLDCLSGADLTKLLERAQKEQEKRKKGKRKALAEIEKLCKEHEISKAELLSVLK